MAPSNPELWAQLAAFRVGDDDAPLPFEARLARENGWSPGFAERACEEYRRFVYLCRISDRPMTPSDQVDQAWHLHLTYTRSYWHDLCRDVLGAPLHHEPTRGGPAEAGKFRAHYAATLAAYEAEFDQPPPADLWPDVETRFAATGQRRINTDAHWVIAKDRVRTAARSTAAIGLASLALAACTLFEVTEQGWQLTDDGVWVMALLIGIPVLILAQWAFLNPSHKKRRGEGGGIEWGCGDSGCSGCGGCSD